MVGCAKSVTSEKNQDSRVADSVIEVNAHHLARISNASNLPRLMLQCNVRLFRGGCAKMARATASLLRGNARPFGARPFGARPFVCSDPPNIKTVLGTFAGGGVSNSNKNLSSESVSTITGGRGKTGFLHRLSSHSSSLSSVHGNTGSICSMRGGGCLQTGNS
jgi:hypothetical protein